MQPFLRRPSITKVGSIRRKNQRVSKYMNRIIALLACFVAITVARADIIPTFTGTSPSGGNTTWSYKIDITTNAQVTTGDFFTIYDFGPFVAGSNVQPAGWTLTSSLVGPTPAGVAPPDDPTITNLTWTYTGPTIPESSGIGPFSVATIGVQLEVQTALTYFAGQATNTNPGSAGSKLNNVGRITVPAPVPVPEPATLSLLALGAGASILRVLRRRK